MKQSITLCTYIGIAVVSVCLVDGAGNQVKLLQCPKPCNLAYADIESRQDMDTFVSTQAYEIQPQSKRPGLSCFICLYFSRVLMDEIKEHNWINRISV